MGKSLQEIKKEINHKCTADFNGSDCSYGISYCKPLDKPPKNIEQALSARRLALELVIIDHPQIKGKWQHYWLSCCLSSKCDYFFNVLKHCGIDRERDIINLCQRKEAPLWEYLTGEEKQLYFDECQRFLLRRYGICEAFKIKKWSACKWFLAGFSRLFVGLIVAYYFSVFNPTLWGMAMAMCCYQYILSCVVLLITSLLYLWYECYTEIERRKWLALGRAFIAGLLNFAISYIFAMLLVLFIKNFPQFFLPEKYLRLAGEINFWYKPPLFFATLAMFISVFVQHFWQEKTVLEPF